MRFHFFNDLFWRAKVFNYDEIQFSNFFTYNLFFYILSKKYLPISDYKYTLYFLLEILWFKLLELALQFISRKFRCMVQVITKNFKHKIYGWNIIMNFCTHYSASTAIKSCQSYCAYSHMYDVYIYVWDIWGIFVKLQSFFCYHPEFNPGPQFLNLLWSNIAFCFSRHWHFKRMSLNFSFSDYFFMVSFI